MKKYFQAHKNKDKYMNKQTNQTEKNKNIKQLRWHIDVIIGHTQPTNEIYIRQLPHDSVMH